MNLKETTTFAVVGEINGFEVGKDIDGSMLTLHQGAIEQEYNVSEAIQKVEFKKGKTYPINSLQGGIEGVTSNDRYLTQEGKTYPMFVVSIDEDTDTLEFMYNDKGQLSYSNHFRKLDKKVNQWYIGYLKEDELAEVGGTTPTVQPSGEGGHILEIIKKIEELDLSFVRTAYTVYDVALKIQQGELSLEELTQDKLNTI